MPLVHLDLIYHDKTFDYQTDKVLWRERVEVLTKESSWILDGNYKSTFDIRLPASDTIIFLDYPTYISIWRAIKRRVQLHNKVRDDMPDTWKEKLDWSFFLFILKFNRKDAPRIRQMLLGYTDAKDIRILTSPKQTRRYLDLIKTVE